MSKYSDIPLYGSAILKDKRAAVQGIISLLKTGSGERLFRPEIAGVLERYQFEPVSNITSAFLLMDMQAIINQDRRFKLLPTTEVTANVEAKRYELKLNLEIDGEPTVLEGWLDPYMKAINLLG